MDRPTALNKRGNKIMIDGHKFDSQKEADFYTRFVRDCGRSFKIHPKFELMPLTHLDGANLSSVRYTPDVVIYDSTGNMAHVYDVKNSFGMYGIDAGNKLRFKWFARIYHIPVEAVVVRAHDFKVIAQGVTKQLPEKSPLVKSSFDYMWQEAAGRSI